VIIQAPRSTVAQLTPYRPTFDISGADIFPIAYPPGEHSDLGNRDISVVGDVSRKMVRAAGGVAAARRATECLIGITISACEVP